LPEAAAVVERASKNKTPESLADAAAAADRVLQEMNSVLDMMIKGQDLQDSINALNIIMEWTQKQKQDIQDQVRKELGNFLNSGPSTRPG
jgi:5-methylcytosine-specific restriction endonuclease McrBC GTP-binding regulatory subunit McrB